MASLIYGINDMMETPGSKLPELLTQMISATEKVTEDAEYHTYHVHTLENLLKHEIYEMSKQDVKVKRCKNCNRYFVLEKGNLEYCDRIAEGETKPCSEIGKSRTYEAKITGGSSPMALYRKAYKTHFARIRTGLMTKEQFEAWKREALDKRELTDSGDLSLDEYTLWLKK